jgi:drug/metabolite transporter (DMT)-like permease
MPFPVIAMMLFSASLSASWNAVIKGAENKLYVTILMTGAAGLLGALVLPFLARPDPAAWPFLAASAACSVVYYAVVARAYHVADLSQTFPIMRGTAPLLVAMSSWLVVGERLSGAGWIGVGLICSGILCLAASSLRAGAAGLGLALVNAALIAVYTLIDGLGVRRSGTPMAYCLWVYVLTSIPLAGWACLFRRKEFVPYVRRHRYLGLAGGAVAIAIYLSTLWAMTVAPVAIVAALRETSILFAVAISAVVLKEPVGSRRVAMVCAIAGGVMVLRLA